MVNQKRKPKGAGRAASLKRVRMDAPSERIVPVPEIAVFSELPFKQIGVIGGHSIPPGQNGPSETQRDGASPPQRRGGRAIKQTAQAAAKSAKKPVRRKKAK